MKRALLCLCFFPALAFGQDAQPVPPPASTNLPQLHSDPLPADVIAPKIISTSCPNKRASNPIPTPPNGIGATVYTLVVATDGTPKDITLVQSSGVPELDEAALSCAEFFRWSPATENGKPVEVKKLFRNVWGRPVSH